MHGTQLCGIVAFYSIEIIREPASSTLFRWTPTPARSVMCVGLNVWNNKQANSNRTFACGAHDDIVTLLLLLLLECTSVRIID